IRSAAIWQAGLVRPDEFRASLEVFVWLAKVLRWGGFRRVTKPLYYRLDHPRSFTNEYFGGSEGRKRGAWLTFFTGLIDATMPLCRTLEERLVFQQAILYRFVFANSSLSDSVSTEKLIGECSERLRYEGNADLLRQEERPLVLREIQRRLELRERSRM